MSDSEEQIQINEDQQKLIAEFLRSLSVRNCSKHTLRNYQNDIEAFFIWANRLELDPLQINYRQFRGYLAEMSSAQYARTTINRRLSSLRSFFKYLDIQNICSNNFASVVQSPKILKKLPAVLKTDDTNRLLDYCEQQIKNASNPNNKSADKKLAIAHRNNAIIQLMYATGARISEISSLTLPNVFARDGYVKLFGKGQKERIVPVYNQAMTALENYINNYRNVLLKGRNTNVCFIADRGGDMSADSIRHMFKQYCAAAGVDSSVHPHSMRHTFATDVLDGGADLRSVQEMLGHASLSTTQIYTHMSPARLKNVHSQAHPRG